MTARASIEAVESLVADLAAEPLFHASMASKELFHSNLLAWMARQFPEYARDAFEPWLTPAEGMTRDQVRREYKHLDLVVELAGFEPLIVENKSFALPDERQLERYTVDAVRAFPGKPSFVLLSLCDPGWSGGTREIAGRTWRWVSYRELGAQLAVAFAGGTGFGEQVILHEARLVRLLDQLMRAVGIHDIGEPFRLGAECEEMLERAGVADAVGKARAHRVRQLIRQALDAEALPAPAWDLEVGFSNGEPLLAGFWQVADDIIVGWQHQHRQWRLAMILRSEGLHGRGRHDERAAFALEHVDYFDFTSMYETLGCREEDCMPRRARTDAVGFNRYDPDFVYRYRLLPDVTVEQFVRLAVAYSRWAVEWKPKTTDKSARQAPDRSAERPRREE